MAKFAAAGRPIGKKDMSRSDGTAARGSTSGTYNGTVDASGTFAETEYALHAKTGGGATTLVKDGHRIFVR